MVLFPEKGGEIDEDVAEHFKGLLRGVEAGDEVFGIAAEHFGGVSLIDVHSGLENVMIEVIGPFFDEGAPLDSLDEDFSVGSFEDDDPLDLDIGVEEVDLAHGTRNAVEEEELLSGEIAVGCDEAMDVVVPDLDGHLVGKEEPFAGVGVEELAGGRLGGEAAKDIARGEVEVVARRTEEFAQGSFAGAGRAEDEDRAKGLLVGGKEGVFWVHTDESIGISGEESNKNLSKKSRSIRCLRLIVNS
jgi:hypothetical protein